MVKKTLHTGHHAGCCGLQSWCVSENGGYQKNNFDVKNDDKPWYLEIPYLQTEPFFGVGNKTT